MGVRLSQFAGVFLLGGGGRVPGTDFVFTRVGEGIGGGNILQPQS